MIVLKLIYTITGVFLFTFLESLFSSLLGINIAFILFLFLYKKVDWRVLFSLMFVVCLIIDVTSHYMLGTNFLVAMLALIFFSVLSIFFSTEVGILSWIVRMFAFFVYYSLLFVLPSFFLNRTFAPITVDVLKISLFRSIISLVIIILCEIVAGRFRKEGDKSNIKLG